MSKLTPSAVLLLIITVNATAQIQKSPNNRVYVDEDYEYTERARMDRNVKEQIEKGMRFYKAANYGAAADAFLRAVQLNPSVFNAHFNAWHFLGFAYYNLRNDSEATKCYLRSLELDERSGVTWNNLGRVYLELDKLDDAEAAFTKALAIEPELTEPVTGLCVAYARLKKSEQAISQCAKARSHKPTIANTYYLAWSYLDLKKYPKAIEVLNDCVRLDPKNPLVYTAIAEGYYQQKRYKEALPYAEKAVQVNPSSQAAYAGMGHIYFGMKKLKEAKKYFEKALTIEPKSATSRYNLAMTCLALNQRDCAREQYAILKHDEPDLSTQLLDQIYRGKVVRLMK